MRLRSFAALLFALSSSLPARSAAADELQSTRFELRETRRAITVTLDRGSARVVVRRSLQNDGARSDQAIYWLGAAADGAIAVGLRTRGTTASGAPVWFAGELMEAEAAAAKYKELTGLGGYTPKDPALLSWRSASQLALQVFPVPPKDEKVVEVTSLAPMTYEDGAYTMKLPAPASEDGAPTPKPTVVVRAARPGDRAWVNGVPASDAPVPLTAELALTLTPHAPPPIEGSLATVEVGTNRVVTHATLAVAPRISAVPEGAAVAIVLDASRSQEDALANETALARAYLAHMKDATVDVFTFDREVHRLTPRPVSVRDAIALLYRPIAVANGSHVDDAIARADAALAARPARAKRMLVLSDLLVRRALSPVHLALRKLTSGALVHLVTVAGGDAKLSRDDESAWARLPQATGGVLWRATYPERLDAAARAAAEELARPTHIDGATLAGLATPFEDFAVDGRLSEGQGFESWAIEAAPSPGVRVDGLLWSTPARFTIGADDVAARRSAALVFGTSLVGELSEPEMMKLAMKGRAVSPVTSYLAIEPGVRPSTDGLDESEIGAGGFGSVLSPSVRGGNITLGPRPEPFDPYAFLAAALGAEARVCGVRGSVSVTVETTAAEVVDVGAVVQRDRRDPKVEACMREAVWKLTLSPRFDAEWMEYTVEVTP